MCSRSEAADIRKGELLRQEVSVSHCAHDIGTLQSGGWSLSKDAWTLTASLPLPRRNSVMREG
jgi:hypothetical protein